MTKRLTTQEFIERARKVHGDKYDYSKVEYLGLKVEVCVICKKHGDFVKKPKDILRGFGCPHCNTNKYTEISLREKCISMYGDKYDFSISNYNSSSRKVHFKCNRCGTIMYKSTNSIISGTGLCKFCDGTGQVRNTTQFIIKAKSIHENKYDYSQSFYKNAHTKVCIICPTHGAFFQTPNAHLRGQGCPLCIPNVVLNDKTFRERAYETHGDKYDYSLVKFKGIFNKYPIICPEHGVFYQVAHTHLSGAGCPMCKESRGERKIANFLTTCKIDYVAQKKVPNDNIFCANKNFYVDFYIPQYDVIIEYNGEQHYIESPFFHGHQTPRNNFERQQERDMALRQYCKEHKIKLIEIPYWELDNVESILEKELNIKLKMYE